LVAAPSGVPENEEMRRRGLTAALAATALLTGGATAWAALTSEGTPYATGGTAPYAINVGDFDGDALPDVATINGDGQSVSVFLRRPGGFTLENGQPIPLGAIPSNAAVGDFGGDPLPDLAVGIFNGNFGVDLLLRQPGGGFTAQPIPSGTGVTAIAAGLFNGDSQLDLAVARAGGNQVSILLRQGTTFAEQPAIAAGAGPAALAVGDFNGDGAADLAVADKGGTTGTTVTVLLAAGDGRFTAQPPVTVGVEPSAIVAADFTGDGRSDFAVANYADGTVSVFDSTGGGFVQEAGSPIAVTTAPAGLAVADVNADGRPDLAVAANGPGTTGPGAVDILLRGASGFALDSAIPVAGRQNAVVAADFDRDTRADLAFSEITNSTFSVLLNPAPAVTPTPTPTPTATPTPLPPPVAGKTVNAARKSGTVRFRRPGSKTFVTLTADAQIPVGSAVDTRKGRITITAAQGKGKTASADFFAGLFKLTQTKGAKPATTLALTEKLSCPRRGKASAAAKKPKTRRLWGSGHGRFTTKGQYSAATVRGTKWLVQDTCATTTTRVAQGVVAVRDFVKRKTIVLRKGKRYVARRR
jgi:hypothetical protein